MVKRILTLLFLSVIANTLFASGFPRPLLHGDYPDPSIMREGKDFYMTHSPFIYSPGFLIWHSTNLIDWEPICRAKVNCEDNIMAPDLLKYKDKYYIYYPSAKAEIFVITSDDIRGPWSEPVKLNMDIKEIDPGHIVGEDGHRYLFTSSGYMTPLSDDGLRVIGKSKKVYDGWDYPRQWKTEGKFLESPKLIFKDGYYYMTSAEGGTAGPATSHMCVMARSKSVFGPWENSPYNPVVHTFEESEPWWSKGHGTLIDDADGNWWMVYHAYANGYHTLGRQTLIEPMEFRADGWFAPIEENICENDVRAHDNDIDHNDDFNGSALNLQWTCWKEDALDKIVQKNSALIIPAKGMSPVDGRVLLMTPEDACYETEVEVETGKRNKAGLVLFYNEKAFAGVVSDGNDFIVYANPQSTKIISNTIGRKFRIKLLNRGNHVTMKVADKNGKWVTLADNVDASYMHHNRYKGFLALRVGLVSAGSGTAKFSSFRYRNAIPQEKDMAAYLLAYHLDETHSLHFAISYDGYNFKTLNNGKPVVDADTVAYEHGIRDPHVYRGPDGAFYAVMTDLNAIAQKQGLRSTEFERDKDEYGWGNNYGFVMMKSWDLINWKHTSVRLDSLSAGLKEMGCAWAPEVVYDDEAGKLMIHYAMRFRKEPLSMYYVYTNNDFNKIETLPRLLYQYPERNIGVLDANITKIGNKYHMFYAVNDGTAGGVKHAISDHINRGYSFESRYYDFETVACEAPSLWKRLGENKWVLMCDVSWLKPQNFGFSETTDLVNFNYIGHFNDGVMKADGFIPKHGSIVYLTADEARHLEEYWNSNFQRCNDIADK